jgi:glycosyltransferase involved in cell wall biosynthesis
MNLGLIIPFLEKYGGAERYFIECIKIWQHKHTITIYTTFLNRELLIEHGIDEHIQFSQLTPYFEGEHSMLLNSLLLPKMWRKEIGHHDLYHAHLWPTHLINLSPMVWMPHEPLRVLHDLRHEQNVETLGNNAARNIHIYPKYNYDRVENSIYESYLDAIDAMDRTAIPECIVSNSQYTASYLENIYNTPVNDIIYPGVEPEMFIELPIDKNLFVTISQLWPHKRINLLIEAIALTSNTQLLIIGSGPDKERLSTIATRLGIEDRIFFLSGLSNNDLSLILARACAFLFSPINEPFGIVVLEAMAAGIPIIAVNQGGYIEACHPDYAFLLPPFPAAFAEKITYLQQHPEIARAMGAKGRLAVTQFTWENTANQMEAVLLKTWNNFTKKQKKSHAENHKTLIGIQYFLWYGDGFGAAHWNDNINSGHVADKPILGYYSSSKGQTIHFHFDLFEQMNLDYIILNLHIDESGVNGLELISIQHVFDNAT